MDILSTLPRSKMTKRPLIEELESSCAPSMKISKSLKKHRLSEKDETEDGNDAIANNENMDNGDKEDSTLKSKSGVLNKTDMSTSPHLLPTKLPTSAATNVSPIRSSALFPLSLVFPSPVSSRVSSSGKGKERVDKDKEDDVDKEERGFSESFLESFPLALGFQNSSSLMIGALNNNNDGLVNNDGLALLLDNTNNEEP